MFHAAITDTGPEDGVSVAHQHALLAAGVTGSSADLLNFLRWRTLRISLALRQITQDETVWAIPLAAAQAAEGRKGYSCCSASPPMPSG